MRLFFKQILLTIMLTIVNEESSLKIVKEGLPLTIVDEMTKFIKNGHFWKKVTCNFIECRLT